MNEISTIVDGDRMTSLQIAEITGKPHADVMKAIRKMEPAWSKINEGNFSLVEYKDKKGETRPCYSLNKEECLYIATKFNDEARAKLIKRWKELEEQHQKPSVPQNYLEALKSLVKSEEEKQQLALENKKQQATILTMGTNQLGIRTLASLHSLKEGSRLRVTTQPIAHRLLVILVTLQSLLVGIIIIVDCAIHSLIIRILSIRVTSLQTLQSQVSLGLGILLFCSTSILLNICIFVHIYV